jgi:hypothetical protein
LTIATYSLGENVEYASDKYSCTANDTEGALSEPAIFNVTVMKEVPPQFSTFSFINFGCAPVEKNYIQEA